MVILSRYPEVLELAAEQRAPQHLVHYLRELAAEFHSYYNAQRMLVDDVRAARRARDIGPRGATGHRATGSSCSACRRPRHVSARGAPTPQITTPRPDAAGLGLDAVRARDRARDRRRRLSPPEPVPAPAPEQRSGATA